MKKIIMMAIAMIATTAARAQHEVGSLTLKPNVGITVAKVTEDDVDSKIGLIGGLELESQISNVFSISGGLAYSQQGGEAEGVKMKLDYLNIPILANIYVARGLALKAGIQPGIKMSAKASASGVTIDLDKVLSQSGVDAEIKSFDLSIPMGLSYEYHNLVFDARYNLGLTKYASVKGYDDGIGRNSVFQITVGYKFDL